MRGGGDYKSFFVVVVIIKHLDPDVFVTVGV